MCLPVGRTGGVAAVLPSALRGGAVGRVAAGSVYPDTGRQRRGGIRAAAGLARGAGLPRVRDPRGRAKQRTGPAASGLDRARQPPRPQDHGGGQRAAAAGLQSESPRVGRACSKGPPSGVAPSGRRRQRPPRTRQGRSPGTVELGSRGGHVPVPCPTCGAALKPGRGLPDQHRVPGTSSARREAAGATLCPRSDDRDTLWNATRLGWLGTSSPLHRGRLPHRCQRGRLGTASTPVLHPRMHASVRQRLLEDSLAASVAMVTGDTEATAWGTCRPCRIPCDDLRIAGIASRPQCHVATGSCRRLAEVRGRLGCRPGCRICGIMADASVAAHG